MTAAPDKVAIAAAASFETILNTVFTLDPTLRTQLSQVSGKVLCITFEGPNLTLYLLPDTQGIAVQAHYEGHVDCRINGKPSDFVELFIADDAASALINGGITVRGESGLLLQIQAIFTHMELDWEYELSKVIGDVAAHQVGQGVRASTALACSAAKTAEAEFKAHIASGHSVFPTRLDVRRFCDDVDDLAARLEHLEAKFNAFISRAR